MAEREGDREKETDFSIYCFTPQMVTKAEAGLGQSQESRTSSGSPHEWQRPTCLNHHLLPLPMAHEQEAGGGRCFNMGCRVSKKHLYCCVKCLPQCVILLRRQIYHLFTPCVFSFEHQQLLASQPAEWLGRK